MCGLVAQVTQGAAGIGIILVVRAHTGSLALAGVVVGALSLAAGVSRPVQGMLIDRRGSARVMAACGVIHPAALSAIVAVSDGGGPRALLVVLGVFAGLALPPVSTCMRVEWARLTGEQERTAAYSLVYLTQEMSILTGPVLFAALAAAGSASLGLVVVAVLAGVGTLGFALSVQETAARGAVTEAAARSPAITGRVVRIRAIQLLLAVAVLLGGVIGALEVAAPTLASAHGAPAASGLLIAALSVGGIAGATIYGARRWQVTPVRRLLGLLALLTALLAPLLAANGLVLAGVLLLLAGLPLNPSLTTFSLLIDQHLSGGGAAEAFGWLSTAIAGGTGAASAIAAAVAQHHHDAQAAFAVALIAAALATAGAFVARGVLGRRAPAAR